MAALHHTGPAHAYAFYSNNISLYSSKTKVLLVLATFIVKQQIFSKYIDGFLFTILTGYGGKYRKTFEKQPNSI